MEGIKDKILVFMPFNMSSRFSCYMLG